MVCTHARFSSFIEYCECSACRVAQHVALFAFVSFGITVDWNYLPAACICVVHPHSAAEVKVVNVAAQYDATFIVRPYANGTINRIFIGYIKYALVLIRGNGNGIFVGYIKYALVRIRFGRICSDMFSRSEKKMVSSFPKFSIFIILRIIRTNTPRNRKPPARIQICAFFVRNSNVIQARYEPPYYKIMSRSIIK